MVYLTQQVRVCEAKRSNEVPSGDFKRRNGLAAGKVEGPRPDKFAFAQQRGAMKAPAGLLSDRTVLRQQDGGAPPRQVRVCGAQRNNKVPSGDFKRRNGLAAGKVEGPRPDKFAFAKRSNGSPSGPPWQARASWYHKARLGLCRSWRERSVADAVSLFEQGFRLAGIPL